MTKNAIQEHFENCKQLGCKHKPFITNEQDCLADAHQNLADAERELETATGPFRDYTINYASMWRDIIRKIELRQRGDAMPPRGEDLGAMGPDIDDNTDGEKE